MNAMCAWMSAGGQVPIPASFQPARGACIISMNFIVGPLQWPAAIGALTG